MIKKTTLILLILVSTIALMGAGCISFKGGSSSGGVYKSEDNAETWIAKTFVEKVNSGEWTRKFDCEWGKEDYYCETADYLRKVLKYKQEFEQLGL